MQKIDKTVRKETVYIAAWVAVFSVLMQAVFLILNRWDYTVLLGNLLGAVAAVGNFFVMGLSVQSAIQKEEKAAKATLKASQSLRMFALFAIAAIGVLLPCFHSIAMLLPLLFPRIAIALRPLFNNIVEKKEK